MKSLDLSKQKNEFFNNQKQEDAKMAEYFRMVKQKPQDFNDRHNAIVTQINSKIDNLKKNNASTANNSSTEFYGSPDITKYNISRASNKVVEYYWKHSTYYLGWELSDYGSIAAAIKNPTKISGSLYDVGGHRATKLNFKTKFISDFKNKVREKQVDLPNLVFTPKGALYIKIDGIDDKFLGIDGNVYDMKNVDLYDWKDSSRNNNFITSYGHHITDQNASEYYANNLVKFNGITDVGSNLSQGHYRSKLRCLQDELLLIEKCYYYERNIKIRDDNGNRAELRTAANGPSLNLDEVRKYIRANEQYSKEKYYKTETYRIERAKKWQEESLQIISINNLVKQKDSIIQEKNSIMNFVNKALKEKQNEISTLENKMKESAQEDIKLELGAKKIENMAMLLAQFDSSHDTSSLISKAKNFKLVAFTMKMSKLQADHSKLIKAESLKLEEEKQYEGSITPVLEYPGLSDLSAKPNSDEVEALGLLENSESLS